MKCIAFLLLLFAAPLHASEPTITGDWSVPVKGLRGRLLFAEDAPFNGTRMAVVYLELQNVSDVGNPMLVDFQHPRLALVDATGKVIPQPRHISFSIMEPPPYTLVLPYDSTLRFRVSVNGYGIPEDGGMALQLGSGLWVISADTQEERFLEGSFIEPELPPIGTEGRQKEISRDNVWRGTLNLPKLKIPLSAPK